jgi:hypothetical protein
MVVVDLDVVVDVVVVVAVVVVVVVQLSLLLVPQYNNLDDNTVIWFLAFCQATE